MGPKKIKKNKNVEPSDNSDSDSDNDNDNTITKSEKIEFFGKLDKYLHYDNLIKETMLEHRKAINNLKSQKKELEHFLLLYLEKIRKDTINVGDEKLVKVDKHKKKPLNKNIIKLAIIEDLKSEKLIKSNEEGEDIVKRMFESMENKRPIEQITQLKRKGPRKKKENPEK